MPLLDPAGPIALGERSVIYTTFALSAIVVLPVFIMLFLFAWRYRASGPLAKRAHAPHWDHDSTIAEIVWWVIPALIILCLSILAWKSSHKLDPYVPLPGTPLEVEVVALNWKWLFIYPELGVASVNELVIPQDVPVHFSLTADAPMNSFWVPQLGGQIMVMPGMSTQLNLMATRVGVFQGSSANISGEGFSGMAFTVRAVSANDFAAWASLARLSPSSKPLTQETYPLLAATSTYDRVRYYAPVGDGLYTTIVNKSMVPMHDMQM
jgi:cytochrome o ubiquinol oxidase subunit 2